MSRADRLATEITMSASTLATPEPQVSGWRALAARMGRSGWLAVLAILAAVFAVQAPAIARVAARSRLHAPDLALITGAPPAVQVHLTAVLAALGVGAWLLIGRKGRLAHRVLGWSWAVFMIVAAGSSLLIHTSGGFSILHGFSAWTLVAVPLGVYAARRHEVGRHRRYMTGVFLGGLVVAGALAFLPGRLMWAMFFG